MIVIIIMIIIIIIIMIINDPTPVVFRYREGLDTLLCELCTNMSYSDRFVRMSLNTRLGFVSVGTTCADLAGHLFGLILYAIPVATCLDADWTVISVW